jgi:signal transduction histidine kinase
VTLIFSNDLSFDDMLKRAATLPAHSAIFYTLLSVDAEGIIQSEERTLAELHAVANAPIFGLYDIQLGRGIVGGSLLSVDDVVRDSASVAVRLLHGESPGGITTRDHTHGQPTFDWRELRRWDISEARLPAGSTILFRQPTAWDEYKAYIVGAGVLIGLQSALIGGLIVQRRRRRRTEEALRRSEQQYRATTKQNQDLAGRLITAQEAERTRIARDLHDDVSQQLAGLSIAFSGLKQQLVEYRIREDLQQDLAELQQQTLALARNVRHLSHDLHPTVLQHVGLAKGLTAYCGQLERTHGLPIRCRVEGNFASVNSHAALCVYRIAQEALRNVIAHAAASHVEVELRHHDDHVELAVTDDGQGFESLGAPDTRDGLGLVSISERAKIAGGTVTIVTAPAKGTRVQAIIPAKTSARTDRDHGTEGQVA